MKRLHTLTPLPCKLTLAQCRKIIIGTPTVTVLWLSICACPIEVNPPAMSAPPIAIFAHDKKAETHADSRAWLKSRVSSPPVKAPVLHKHSPVSRKGSSLQKEDDSLSRVKLCHASVMDGRYHADYVQTRRVPELPAGRAFSATFVRLQRPTRLLSQE